MAACWRGANCPSTWRRYGARHRHHRPAGGQSVPVRSHRRQGRLHARRCDREHRHRRPGHGALGGQELEGRGRAHRRRPSTRWCCTNCKTDGKLVATRPASPCRWPRSTASATMTRRSATTSPASRTGGSPQPVPRAVQRPLRASCRTCATARTRTSRRRSIATCIRRPARWCTARQLQGKELSYNNIADADAAWECVKSFDAPACVIVKHANPCGVAVGANAFEAYAKAFKTDPDLGLRRHHRFQPHRWMPRRRRPCPSSSSKC